MEKKRIGLSKRQRFAVFERDEFTCRYCGRTPPSVLLVLDHVIPFSQGGQTTKENLVTSCESCNQGKADKILGSNSLPEGDFRRLAQESLEQTRKAKLDHESCKAHLKLRQSIVDLACEIFGLNELDTRNISCFVNITQEFGIDKLTQWLERAVSKIGTDRERDCTKYVCGIARIEREKRNANPR